jgi:hypothetical protein
VRRFAWSVLAFALTGWSAAGFCGVSPNNGAHNHSGAKIKPPQQQEADQPSDPKEYKR